MTNNRIQLKRYVDTDRKHMCYKVYLDGDFAGEIITFCRTRKLEEPIFEACDSFDFTSDHHYLLGDLLRYVRREFFDPRSGRESTVEFTPEWAPND